MSLDDCLRKADEEMSRITEEFRRMVFEANMALPAHGLVVWTSGNVSARDASTGLVAIKPSGVPYAELAPEQIVVVDLDGQVVEGDLKPSDDTATHLCLYRQRPSLGAVVHTHSPYATAWAAVGKPIPAVLSSIVDILAGPCRVGSSCRSVGLRSRPRSCACCGISPAVLMQNHGVFCFGDEISVAVRAAVMTEEVAKIVMLSLSLGTPIELPQDFVSAQHAFYLTAYGQRPNASDIRNSSAAL